MFLSMKEKTLIVLLTAMFMVMPLVAMAEEAPETHVALVDKATAYDRAKMAGGAVTVLEDYGTFAMVEATEAELSRMTVRRDLDDRTVLGLAGYSFDTRDGLPDLPPKLVQEAPDQGHGYFLVQFKGPIKADWRYALESVGGELETYIPNNAYIVRMEVDRVDDVRALPSVIWVGHYQPAFKVNPDAWEWKGDIRLDIALHQGEDAYKVAAGLEDLGAEIVIVSADQINPTIEAFVQDLAIHKVALMNEVWWIENHYMATLLPNDPAQWILQSNVNGYYPLYDHGLHGENMTMGNADTGIHVAHLAFHDANRAVQYSAPAATTPPDTQHRKIVNYWTFGDDYDDYGHGTLTAGVNVGDNDANNGNPQYHGIAYRAKLSFQDVWNDATWQDMRPADKGQMYYKTWADGGWVHSGSLVCVMGGEYNTEAMELDQFLWTEKDFLGVIANHNYGSGDIPNSVCDLASAKGTMSIGAVYNNPDQEDLHDYTGRGPTDDGRLKPTLSSVTDVNAPQDDTNNGFDEIGGTSGATPSAAGAMTIARQYFYDGFYPKGQRNAADGFNASGALMKAIGVNSAEEMTGANAYEVPYNGMDYPSNTQGWGRLNLDNALYFAGDMRGLYLDDNRTGLSTGEESHHEVEVLDDDMPVEATLVWTDYWGQPLAVKELVNDLDLTVTAPDGTTVYKGNVLTGAAYPRQSVTGGSYDDLNVVENVLKFDPQIGTWEIDVTAVTTPQGPQPFALVFTGNITKPVDLAIRPMDLKISNLEPNEGDSLTFNISTRNLGGNLLPSVDSVVKVDGEVFDTRSLSVGGAFTTFELDYEPEWGSHTVSVEIDPNDAIEEAFENNNYVEKGFYVNKIPIANFEATPLEIFTYENVTVNASTSEDDDIITKYKFDWGDGKVTNWQASPEAIHMYKANGEYNVSVQVQDNRSVLSDWAPNVTVEVKNRAPWVNASASAYEALTYENISFDGIHSGDMDGTITYLWDLGDGNTTDDPMPMHEYEDDGFYNITLTVTDDDGAENSTTFEIVILNRAPGVSFVASGSFGNATTEFTFQPFTYDMDGEVVEYVWDFGDGNTSSDEKPVHYYGDDGSYNVTLHALDDDGAQSNVYWWLIDIVNLPPTANASVNVTELYTYEPFHFNSTSLDIDGLIVEYIWNTGDGGFYYTEEIDHYYKEDGTYKINLKIKDDDDAMDEVNITVRVLNRAPITVAEYKPTIIAGQSINLSAEGSYDQDGSIINYKWDFGNDTIRRGNVVNYTFWDVGVYYFNLTVTDNDLATTTTMYNITVEAPPPPPPPPPDDDLFLPLAALMGIIALIIIVALILTVLMILKRKKAKGPKGPSGFDPNASAQTPAFTPPAGHPTEYGQTSYEYSGYQNVADETVEGYQYSEYPTTEEVPQEPATEEVIEAEATKVEGPPPG
jgi:PKD repeat protein